MKRWVQERIRQVAQVARDSIEFSPDYMHIHRYRGRRGRTYLEMCQQFRFHGGVGPTTRAQKRKWGDYL